MVSSIKQLKAAIRHPYAWPGGYEISAIMSDGGVLCMKCCKDNFSNIVDSTKRDIRDGWKIEAIDCVWEGDCNCEQCGKSVVVYPSDEEDSTEDE